MEFSSQQEYLQFLSAQAMLPEGFSSSVTSLRFFPGELPSKTPYTMNLSLITLDNPTDSFGAVFTRNAFPGAPVIIGKKRMTEKTISGVIINNRISNVAAPGGREDVEKICSALAENLGGSPAQYFMASTGIIGWKLPTKEIIEKIPDLSHGLTHGSLLPVAQAIMTTDTYPKLRAQKLEKGTIIGTAKGAGMIEPNMGTMLAFILTDIALEKETLQQILTEVTAHTFNKISIDGDQSTSDMILALSSNKKKLRNPDLFKNALFTVCRSLAEDIVRNGEGVTHVIKVTTEHAPSEEVAVQAGKAVVNSPLVKTAIFGNDPNVGRIVGALGDYLGNNSVTVKTEAIKISIGDTLIFAENQCVLSKEKEILLKNYLENCSYTTAGRFPPHGKTVNIRVDMGTGYHYAEICGADLTSEYVKENADYRS